jgi:hypothetical protein
MPIIETPTGWTFDLAGRSYGPYPTREEAAEAAYDAERGVDYAETLSTVCRAVDAAVAASSERKRAICRQVDRLLAEDVSPELAEDAEPAAIVLAHLDAFTETEEERAWVRNACAEDHHRLEDWAHRLTRPTSWHGVLTSPGVYDGEGLAHTPRLSVDASGDLFVQCGGEEPSKLEALIDRRIMEPPQKVSELVTLKRRGLVILDAEEEVFIMTQQECADQEGFEMDEGAAELAELSLENRVFASIVREFFTSVPESHRAMGEAGMLLLACACRGGGDGLPDDASDEAIEDRQTQTIWDAGYTAGRAALMNDIERRLAQSRAEGARRAAEYIHARALALEEEEHRAA